MKKLTALIALFGLIVVLPSRPMKTGKYHSILVASHSGNLEDLDGFLRDGVDPNIQQDFFSPLRGAATIQRDVNMVKILLMAGAHIDDFVRNYVNKMQGTKEMKRVVNDGDVLCALGWPAELREKITKNVDENVVHSDALQIVGDFERQPKKIPLIADDGEWGCIAAVQCEVRENDLLEQLKAVSCLLGKGGRHD